jgi:hypothetical protein
MKTIKVLLLALLVTGAYTTTLAQKPGVVVSDKEGWHKIGETTVDFTTETDQIYVVGKDKFGSIKIKITDAPMHLMSVMIYYENGDSQMVNIGKEIKAPGETGTVKLHKEGEIKKVSFVYRTLPNNQGKKAHVELWGMKGMPPKSNSHDGHQH